MGQHAPSLQTNGQVALASGDDGALSFELFVCEGFCEFELTSVLRTLELANTILGQEMFTSRVVSNTPGRVKGQVGMMVWSEPAIDDYGFSNVMVVVGGVGAKASTDWLRRVRAMQRKARPVVLLSDAATSYLKSAKKLSGKVTTHWSDADVLQETDFQPNLTYRLSEVCDGVITAAGAGATCELMIGLISGRLSGPQVAELGHRLLLPTLRRSDAEQPRTLADNEALFDRQITRAIRLMEDNIADPITMADLVSDLGISTRQLERAFRRAFDDTPARFYKRLRTKRAYALVRQTLMPLVEIAVATGFGSVSSLSQAVRDEYGQTPTKLRTRVGAGFSQSASL